MIEWIPISKQKTRKGIEVYKVSDEKITLDLSTIGKWGSQDKGEPKDSAPDAPDSFTYKNWRDFVGYEKQKKPKAKLTFKDMLNKMKENEGE